MAGLELVVRWWEAPREIDNKTGWMGRVLVLQDTDHTGTHRHTHRHT